MKNVLSSIDLISVVRELNEILKGAVIQKIYHVGDELLFHFYSPIHKKQILRVIIGKLIHLTSFVKENPQFPSNFCMYLRKYFNGSVLQSVIQPRLERVVVLRLKKEETLDLVFELFGQGNVIIVKDGVIKHCLKFQRFSAREIRPGIKYVLPPSEYDLSLMDYVSFKRVIKGSEKDVVRTLATKIGTGGPIAEEICFLSGVEKTKAASELSDDEIKKCFDVFVELVKKVKYGEINPRVIIKNGVVDVSFLYF